ncbi:hypothetical protein BV898_09489 [Hypsibius exemplaris]|uniref:Uncharacterized protein n=1 Tax=Hypsibius exemplaris TaxID=2072580 RepID=A0A1W0WMB2_HYPEX|nr:hypothetical protein BV898_09489 [Hypsibius exemplaris]
MHSWTSIEILLDENSTNFYFFAARLTNAMLKEEIILADSTIYASANHSHFDFQFFLTLFATRNRILLFLGSPVQLRLLLVSQTTVTTQVHKKKPADLGRFSKGECLRFTRFSALYP